MPREFEEDNPDRLGGLYLDSDRQFLGTLEESLEGSQEGSLEGSQEGFLEGSQAEGLGDPGKGSWEGSREGYRKGSRELSHLEEYHSFWERFRAMSTEERMADFNRRQANDGFLDQGPDGGGGVSGSAVSGVGSRARGALFVPCTPLLRGRVGGSARRSQGFGFARGPMGLQSGALSSRVSFW